MYRRETLTEDAGYKLAQDRMGLARLEKAMNMITTEPPTMADYPKAEREAERIVKEYGINRAPVNAIGVANHLGYSVVAANLKISGRLILRNGQVQIEVNAYDPPNRRRFTIAHELGHLVLMHTTGFPDLVIPETIDERRIDNREIQLAARQDHDGIRPVAEAEADRFAAALLMPSDLVREMFSPHYNVKALARTFEVSEQAMDIRLKQLGLAN